MSDQSVNPATIEEGLVILLCPYCQTQALYDPRKPRKRVKCLRCLASFRVPRHDCPSECAHCHVPLCMSWWLAGQVAKCPACGGALKIVGDG